MDIFDKVVLRATIGKTNEIQRVTAITDNAVKLSDGNYYAFAEVVPHDKRNVVLTDEVKAGTAYNHQRDAQPLLIKVGCEYKAHSSIGISTVKIKSYENGNFVDSNGFIWSPSGEYVDYKSGWDIPISVGLREGLKYTTVNGNSVHITRKILNCYGENLFESDKNLMYHHSGKCLNGRPLWKFAQLRPIAEVECVNVLNTKTVTGLEVKLFGVYGGKLFGIVKGSYVDDWYNSLWSVDGICPNEPFLNLVEGGYEIYKNC